MDSGKNELNILAENKEENASDNDSNNSGESHCDSVYSRAVKVLLEHSVDVDAFAKILQMKEENVAELQGKLSDCKELINMLNQKIIEKDNIIAALSNNWALIENAVAQSMDLLTNEYQKGHQSENIEYNKSIDKNDYEGENISQQLNQITNNDINKPIKSSESTIKKLDETLAELNIKVFEKEKNLTDVTKKINEYENDLHIYTPYGTCERHKTHTPPFRVALYKFNALGYLLIQNRHNEKFSFERTLIEYHEGFGDCSGDFWMGLEYIHIITNNQPHVLRIEMYDYAGKMYFAEYDNFVVGGKDENYKLKSLGDYKGTAGDMMRLSENQEFCLCPKLKRGWWDLKGDHQLCNLNGNISRQEITNKFEFIYWGLMNWGNSCNNIRQVIMLLTPKAAYLKKQSEMIKN
ncbi:angiopoietin-2-like [Drosophila sulfurigaster albostrigata]|uniref:angiopoietin-2-like n=1 Tax=Drosophila sulfurigaster albostrigata TaxID=89887 RepID=UPI002D21B449|nr:angiopoietin-2-like [Drosophila sulfurigaster albostrigata]